MSTTRPPARPSAARARLLDAATRLFYEEGIHAVGVDRIIAEAGVTRATLYKQFAGKENLVLAYLEGEDALLRGLFDAAAAGTSDPERLLDATIGGIAADVRQRHTRGCPFINAAAEYPDANGPVRMLITEHREWFRSTLQALAAGAGLEDPEDAAGALVLLRDAALVGGYLDGDDRVTPAFERSARALIDAHRPR
ncbi:TetR/AcrR family transcriptional regulator [Microbacterium sp. CIAB417]|uniref:TetR/AcrR family transcriptional regulator n=1 Tax=Microbacterium sp. CIAB417 TaxID=2860287 RepID=UPI001FAC7D3D|nr:TetR/AcrR family transcriptional regulator [Microbacterium sp. CIAB417]